MPQFDHSSNNNIGLSSIPYYGSHDENNNNYIMTSNDHNYHMGNNYENINLVVPIKENMSSFEEGGSCSVDSSFDNNNKQWTFQDDFDDLQSVAFRYLQHS